MNRLFAIVGTVIIVSVLLVACGKNKPAIDMAAVDAGVAAVNSHLPIQLGVDLTLTKASVVGNQVVLDAFSRRVIGWELERTLQARLTLGALQRAIVDRQPPPGVVHHSDRGVQYACGDPAARSILNAGFNINHRVNDAEGHELLTTLSDLAVCANYR